MYGNTTKNDKYFLIRLSHQVQAVVLHLNVFIAKFAWFISVKLSKLFNKQFDIAWRLI